MLVECCVALLLLAVCSTLVLLSAAGTATLVDAAVLEDQLQRAEATIGARVQLDACAGGTALSSVDWGPRLSIHEAHLVADSLHRVDIAATWQASALSWSAGRSVTVSTAGLCE